MLCLSKNEHRRDGGSREGRGPGGNHSRPLFVCRLLPFSHSLFSGQMAAIIIWHYCFVGGGGGSVPPSVQVWLNGDSKSSVGASVCAVVPYVITCTPEQDLEI